MFIPRDKPSSTKKRRDPFHSSGRSLQGHEPGECRLGLRQGVGRLGTWDSIIIYNILVIYIYIYLYISNNRYIMCAIFTLIYIYIQSMVCTMLCYHKSLGILGDNTLETCCFFLNNLRLYKLVHRLN